MTPEQFCYWLQGRAELVAGPPTEAEWKSIVEHLGIVFNKVTQTAPGSLMKSAVDLGIPRADLVC